MPKDDPVKQVITGVGDAVIGGAIDAAGAVLNFFFGPSEPEKPEVECHCHEVKK